LKAIEILPVIYIEQLDTELDSLSEVKLQNSYFLFVTNRHILTVTPRMNVEISISMVF